MTKSLKISLLVSLAAITLVSFYAIQQLRLESTITYKDKTIIEQEINSISKYTEDGINQLSEEYNNTKIELNKKHSDLESELTSQFSTFNNQNNEFRESLTTDTYEVLIDEFDCITYTNNLEFLNMNERIEEYNTNAIKLRELDSIQSTEFRTTVNSNIKELYQKQRELLDTIFHTKQILVDNNSKFYNNIENQLSLHKKSNKIEFEKNDARFKDHLNQLLKFSDDIGKIENRISSMQQDITYNQSQIQSINNELVKINERLKIL